MCGKNTKAVEIADIVIEVVGEDHKDVWRQKYRVQETARETEWQHNKEGVEVREGVEGGNVEDEDRLTGNR